MNIETWLSEFSNAWSGHYVDKVLSLFTPDVEYWETPSKLLSSYGELRNEWNAIDRQKDITIMTRVYSSFQNKHTVVWNLRYTDQENKSCEWAGTYLISLNDSGLCSYFHQTGEEF